MAVCRTCGGRGVYPYSSTYRRDVLFGMPEHQAYGTQQNVEDICYGCWGSGTDDVHGVNPRSRVVLIENQEFLPHPKIPLFENEFFSPVRFPHNSKSWRYKWLHDESFMEEIDRNALCYWANFAGRGSKQVAIPKSAEIEPPFWATHLFVRKFLDIAPEPTDS